MDIREKNWMMNSRDFVGNDNGKYYLEIKSKIAIRVDVVQSKEYFSNK